MIDFDVDIDSADRDKIIALFKECTPAMRMDDNGNRLKHNTGVYFQYIPKEPVSGLAVIDYKTASEADFLKIDFLNNKIYEQVKNPAHLDKLLNTEPMWDLFLHEDVTEQLYHLNGWHRIIKQYPPNSVDDLAALLALIRPAKKYLVGYDWSHIRKNIWKKEDNDLYFFKKSHAYAFATAIIVQLNLLVEDLVSSSD